MAASQATAATMITRTFDFTGTNVYGLPGGIFSGSATVTFQTDTQTNTSLAGATLHNSTMPTAYPFSWAYWTSTQTLYLGGSNGGAEGLFAGTDDFFVHILNPGSSNPTLTWLAYSTSASTFGDTRTGSLTFKDVTSAVPEPSTWAMMIIGFLGAGVSLRRARRDRGLAHA